VTDAAELLERARVASGLTQEELARRAGTSRPTLSAGVVVADGGQPDLSAFQLEVATLFFALPASKGFGIMGGSFAPRAISGVDAA
jgi:hypothetical protein